VVVPDTGGALHRAHGILCDAWGGRGGGGQNSQMSTVCVRGRSCRENEALHACQPQRTRTQGWRGAQHARDKPKRQAAPQARTRLRDLASTIILSSIWVSEHTKRHQAASNAHRRACPVSSEQPPCVPGPPTPRRPTPTRPHGLHKGPGPCLKYRCA
jgi:hypothetical protein